MDAAKYLARNFVKRGLRHVVGLTLSRQPAIDLRERRQLPGPMLAEPATKSASGVQHAPMPFGRR
jgi:hypothetical protein